MDLDIRVHDLESRLSDFEYNITSRCDDAANDICIMTSEAATQQHETKTRCDSLQEQIASLQTQLGNATYTKSDVTPYHDTATRCDWLQEQINSLLLHLSHSESRASILAAELSEAKRRIAAIEQHRALQPESVRIDPWQVPSEDAMPSPARVWCGVQGFYRESPDNGV